MLTFIEEKLNNHAHPRLPRVPFLSKASANTHKLAVSGVSSQEKNSLL